MREAPPPSIVKPPSSVALERLSWAQTTDLIRADFQRLVTWYGGGSLMRRIGWFLQSNYQCLFWYRLSRHLYLNGWRTLARMLSIGAVYFTGAELPPTTSIGPGALIAHSFGVIVFGKIGARVSIFGQAGTGGGFSEEDIGGGPGYPVVGDDVVFGIKAIVLGAVRIGDRVKLGPMSFTKHDVPDDGLVVTRSSRIVRRRALSRRDRRTDAPDVAAALDTAAAPAIPAAPLITVAPVIAAAPDTAEARNTAAP